MLQKLTATILIGLIALAGQAQTPDRDERLQERLQRALERFPEADTNGDGVLTREEARTFLENNPDIRRDENAESDESRVPTGGEAHIYKTVGDVELSLYVFVPIDHEAGEPKPAVVFFFGGGWTTGSPTQFQPQCEYLAERGIIGITVDYRVRSRHQAQIDDCIEDAKSAMRWVRANAAQLGVDPDRIAAGGGSAGGHLAACTAVIESLNDAHDDLGVSAQPNAMVLFNPAMALAADPRMTPAELRRVEQAEGRARAGMANVSPLTFAEIAQPPCIMFFGTGDPLLRGAQWFQEDSLKVGNVCELLTYEGQGHGFFNRSPFRDLTMQEMDRFLTALGWLAPRGGS